MDDIYPNETPEDLRPAPTARSATRVSIFQALQTLLSVAIVMATVFTLWTPANLFSNEMLENMLASIQQSSPEVPVNQPGWPTATALPRPKIGIVSGHWGNDPGATCADGLTEEGINLRIATMVKENLQAEGYDVELLQEFDTKLTQYQANVLLSSQNDSCEYINNEATGFKVAAAMATLYPEKANRLTNCLIQRYQAQTGMKYHHNTITTDMTSYHAFDEINGNTTAAIIETGFLNLDREILTEHTEVVAQGVTAGILCYIRNENIPSETPLPAATP